MQPLQNGQFGFEKRLDVFRHVAQVHGSTPAKLSRVNGALSTQHIHEAAFVRVGSRENQLFSLAHLEVEILEDGPPSCLKEAPSMNKTSFPIPARA